MYPEVQLYVDGTWTQCIRRPLSGCDEPLHGRACGEGRACRPLRPRSGAGGSGQRVQGMAESVRVRPIEGDAQGRQPAARARRRDRATADDGAGQAAGRGEGRSAGRRRRDRLVRRGSAPHLWPRHSRARRRHLPACREGTGRPGRRIHAVEFSDQPGGAQAVLRAGRGLLDHREGAGRNTRLPSRTDPLLRRCGRAGRSDQPGLWRAVRDLRIPDPASDHPQDFVHRLHRRRQAARGDRGSAHEARTMELGGHAPAIVFDDADVDTQAACWRLPIS